MRCRIAPHPRAKGRACGVELTTGEQIHANAFVASGLNPQQTFLELMPPEAVPATVRDAAAQFQYNLLAPSVRSAPGAGRTAALRGRRQRPELNEAFMVLVGLERFGSIPRDRGRP